MRGRAAIILHDEKTNYFYAAPPPVFLPGLKQITNLVYGGMYGKSGKFWYEICKSGMGSVKLLALILKEIAMQYPWHSIGNEH